MSPRHRLPRWLVGLLALVMAGSAVPAAAAGPVDPGLMARGLASHDAWYPSDLSGCRPGNAVCVDNLVREMERSYDGLGCNHNAVFSVLYLRTTEGISAAIAAGAFDEPNLLAHQAYVFGRYYLDPLRAWQKGRIDEVPEAWQIAFESADEQAVTSLGDMYLGINAHVNRDLPFILAAIGMVGPDGSSRKPDHNRVNGVLEQTRPVAGPEIYFDLDPDFFSPPPPDATPVSVPEWRERAWQNAERLVNATTSEERIAVAAEIEADAADEARDIVEQHAYAEDDPRLAARTAHCADVRG